MGELCGAGHKKERFRREPRSIACTIVVATPGASSALHAEGRQEEIPEYLPLAYRAMRTSSRRGGRLLAGIEATNPRGSKYLSVSCNPTRPQRLSESRHICNKSSQCAVLSARCCFSETVASRPASPRTLAGSFWCPAKLVTFARFYPKSKQWRLISAGIRSSSSIDSTLHRPTDRCQSHRSRDEWKYARPCGLTQTR